MDTLRRVCRGRTFFRFLCSYLVMLLIPIIVGVVVYNKAVNIVERNAHEANASSLERCIDMLDSRFAELEGIATQLSMNPKILEFARESSPYVDRTIPYKINEMQQLIAPVTFSNNFIDMLCIYFHRSQVTISNTQAYISLPQFYDGLFKYGDMCIEDWLEKILGSVYYNRYFPVDSIYVGAVGDQRRSEAQPMLMYMHSFPADTLDKGHVFAFIPKKKIEDLLQEITMKQDGWAYIVDANGLVLSTFSNNNQSLNPNAINYVDDNYFGYEIMDISGKKMIVTNKISPYNGWKYVAVMPYYIVMEQVQYIKQLVIVVLLISMLLELVGAYILAYCSFKPIYSIISFVQELFGEKQTNNKLNEYAYLRGSIQNLVLHNKSMQENLEKQLPFLRTTFFEHLLSGDLQSEKEIDWFIEQLSLDKFHGKIAVAVSQIVPNSGDSETPLLEMGAIRLIMEAALMNYLDSFYFHSISFDKHAIIFILDNSCPDLYGYLNEVLNNVYNHLRKLHNIMINFSVGSIVDTNLEISHSYEEAKDTLQYRLMRDSKAIIWYSEILRESESYYYPLQLENRLVNYSRLGALSEVHKLLKRVYKENFIKVSLDPDMVKYLFYELRGTAVKIIDMMTENEHDIRLICDKIRALDEYVSIDHVFESIVEIFESICCLAKDSKKNRSNDVLSDILMFIQNNYADTQLSLQNTAEHFGFSSAYLSQIFKEHIGYNFSNYIEQIRISKAVELLSHNMNINEVYPMVGYNSAYVFRKAFKRSKGINPSQYKTEMFIEEVHGSIN